MKKVVLSLAAVGVIWGGNITLMPYGAYINYEDSKRDNAYILGMYGAKKIDRVLLEGSAEYMYIDYNSKANQDYYKQSAMTLMGTYYYQNNWAFKGGVVNIWSKTDIMSTEYDNVFKIAAQYYQYLQYNVEGALYYSNYDNFKVYQGTLKAGESFTLKEFPKDSFYLEGVLNQIHLTKKGYAPKKNYTNFDLRFNIYDPQWMASFQASLGKNAYKVANDGWVVYNLGEEYKYSLQANWQYYLSKNSSLKIGYSRSKFNENSTKDSYVNIVSLSLVSTF